MSASDWTGRMAAEETAFIATNWIRNSQRRLRVLRTAILNCLIDRNYLQSLVQMQYMLHVAYIWTLHASISDDALQAQAQCPCL